MANHAVGASRAISPFRQPVRYHRVGSRTGDRRRPVPVPRQCHEPAGRSQAMEARILDAFGRLTGRADLDSREKSTIQFPGWLTNSANRHPATISDADFRRLTCSCKDCLTLRPVAGRGIAGLPGDPPELMCPRSRVQPEGTKCTSHHEIFRPPLSPRFPKL